MASLWDRITTETWPAKMARALIGAATLPGDVYAGRVPVTDDSGQTSSEVVNRSADLAGLLTLGAGALPAESNSLRSGMSIPPDVYKKAYDLGQKTRAAKDVWRSQESPTGSFLNDWAYGHIPNLHPDHMTFVEMGMSPAERAFYESGVRGLDYPVYTSGSRYGTAPKSGRSYNYMDDFPEHGVSMAKVDHPSASDYSWYPIYSGNMPDPTSYEGWLLPFRGSDGEPLMVGLKPKKP